jgi:hypothetical protein
MATQDILKEANQKLNIWDDLAVEKNKNLVIVYCPPKVGSTTIVSSIRMSSYNKFTVLHIHDELMLKVLCNIENVSVKDIIVYNQSLGKNVYVIDIYRSPIEQKISKYFEKLSTYHFNNSPLLINNYNVNKIVKRFNSLFPHLKNEDHYKNAYKIPVPEGFDFQNKYLNQTIDGVKYIKLRLKDSDQWGQILTTILGTQIMIINDYETDKKPINEMFSKFKDAYKIPGNLLKIIEEDPLLKCYYSVEERNEYLNMWGSKQTTIFIPFTDVEYALYEEITNENQYMFEVQRTHYLDEGCTCKACEVKRNTIMERIQKGEKVTEKIVHEQAKMEYLKDQAKNLRVIIPPTVQRQSVNQKKLRSTFGGSMMKTGASGINIKLHN